MAHLLAPQPSHPSMPVFFNVDGVVGAAPAQNEREDVLLVQFILRVIAKSPDAMTEPQLQGAVRVTGMIDPATINAIRALQTGFKKEMPGQVVDGRVSPARGGYTYGVRRLGHRGAQRIPAFPGPGP